MLPQKTSGLSLVRDCLRSLTYAYIYLLGQVLHSVHRNTEQTHGVLCTCPMGPWDRASQCPEASSYEAQHL